MRRRGRFLGLACLALLGLLPLRSAAKSLVIRNRSTTERLQATLTPPAAPFALTGNTAPAIVAPGGQLTVRISFKPLKKRKGCTGALKLNTSDQAHPAASVKLTGTGK